MHYHVCNEKKENVFLQRRKSKKRVKRKQWSLFLWPEILFVFLPILLLHAIDALGLFFVA